MAKKLSKRVVVELDSGNLELDVIVDDRMAGDMLPFQILRVLRMYMNSLELQDTKK